MIHFGKIFIEFSFVVVEFSNLFSMVEHQLYNVFVAVPFFFAKEILLMVSFSSLLVFYSYLCNVISQN